LLVSIGDVDRGFITHVEDRLGSADLRWDSIVVRNAEDFYASAKRAKDDGIVVVMFLEPSRELRDQVAFMLFTVTGVPAGKSLFIVRV
jgi:hypothetical protein